mgnify:CR=1 FL=1
MAMVNFIHQNMQGFESERKDIRIGEMVEETSRESECLVLIVHP